MKNASVFRAGAVAVRVLLAAALVLACMPPVPAMATEADDVSASVDTDASEDETAEETESNETVEETSATVSLDDVAAGLDFSSLASSDELAEGYIESVFYDDVTMGTSSSSLSTQACYGAGYLSGDALDLYTQLYEFVGTVAAQGGTTEFTYAYEYSGMGSLTSVGERACSALDLDEVFLCLLVDCPYSLYWFDKTVGLAYLVGSGTTSGRTSTVTSLSLCFTPAEAYAGSSTYSVDETKARSTTVAAANAAQIVADYASETSVLAKLTAYKDEICALVSYDSDADDDTAYGDIWQLVYVFDGDSSTNVVCEGYSKAFQYLCDLTWPDNDPITCYTVTGTLSGGTGAGGHMWNLVALDGTDGSYLVDVTNSDAGTVGEDGGLFLASGADATGSASAGYVLTLSSMQVGYAYDSDTLGLYGSYATTTSGSGPGGRGVTQQVYSSDVLTLASAAFEDVTEEAQLLAAIPAAAQGLVYTGAQQTGVAASALYTVSGGTATDAGTYTATLSLVDPDSYTWVGTGSSDDVQVSWVISAASLKSATLSKKSYVYKAGMKRKPGVTVRGVGGAKLSKGSDYTLAYASGRTRIGSYTVTVTGKGNYTGSIVKTFKIRPGKATLKSLKASTAGSRTLTVQWKKLAGGVRYRIAYRVKGTGKWKFRNVAAGTGKKALAKLKAGKVYQVKVRAYKSVGGTKYYGSWSKVKTATVK